MPLRIKNFSLFGMLSVMTSKETWGWHCTLMWTWWQEDQAICDFSEFCAVMVSFGVGGGSGSGSDGAICRQWQDSADGDGIIIYETTLTWCQPLNQDMIVQPKIARMALLLYKTNGNALTENAELDLTGDETTWAWRFWWERCWINSPYCWQACRISIGISKGVQNVWNALLEYITVVGSDVHRIQPQSLPASP